MFFVRKTGKRGQGGGQGDVPWLAAHSQTHRAAVQGLWATSRTSCDLCPLPSTAACHEAGPAEESRRQCTDRGAPLAFTEGCHAQQRLFPQTRARKAAKRGDSSVILLHEHPLFIVEILEQINVLWVHLEVPTNKWVLPFSFEAVGCWSMCNVVRIKSYVKYYSCGCSCLCIISTALVRKMYFHWQCKILWSSHVKMYYLLHYAHISIPLALIIFQIIP